MKKEKVKRLQAPSFRKCLSSIATYLLIGVIGSLSSCICNPEGQTEVTVVVRSGNGHARAGGSCTGDASCKVCKNCKYCKHCSRQGGSCGVCR